MVILKEPFFKMAEQLGVFLVECQHCTIEFCVQLGKSRILD
jgi:hypothetical protein